MACDCGFLLTKITVVHKTIVAGARAGTNMSAIAIAIGGGGEWDLEVSTVTWSLARRRIAGNRLAGQVDQDV